jgi:large subunit ribosomal protein L27
MSNNLNKKNLANLNQRQIKKATVIPIFKLDLQFFAQKKGGGSAATNRSHDSISKRLGVKKFGDEYVKDGEILVRQRGSKFLLGSGVYFGGDYTIHADSEGTVKFFKAKRRGKSRTFVSVLPLAKPN